MSDSPFAFVTANHLNEQDLSLDANLLFTNAADFSYFIEKSARDSNRTCTAVILEYCDTRDMEPGDVAKLISMSLKGKIECEMVEAGMLPERITLD